jgi:predicted secreted protein
MKIQLASALAVTSLLLALPLMAADRSSTTEDGLVPIQVKNVDKAWKRPDASLKGYTSVLIRPVSVAFNKSWNPRDYGVFGLKSDEVERLRTDLSKIASDTFSRVLAKGGYSVATAPGENILEVQADIVDLVINGVEPRSASNVHVYVTSAGEMRLLLTLRDSITGTTLYRASDFKRGEEYDRLEWANSVFNRAEAERALEGWARQLKSSLDAAKAAR